MIRKMKSHVLLGLPMTQSFSESAGIARNPLELLAHAHAVQERLCDALERIADGLPDAVDRRLCAEVTATLIYDMPLHHRDEEQALFPLLRQKALAEDQLDDILDRLASEHQSDTDFAGEIAESLEILGRGDKVRNPDMVGYMLRGFFERYRRHLHWENTLVMPLARQRLTDEDLQALAMQMGKNRADFL